MKVKNDKDIYLQSIFVKDPATCCIEICSVPKARADLDANQVELAWLTKHTLPNKVMLNRGTELLAECKTVMANDYGIPYSSISKKYTSKCNRGKSTPNYW